MSEVCENKTDSKDKVNFISYVVPLFAILAPGAYIIGLFYHQGYLEGAGIEPQNFSINVQEAYVHAYYATTWFVMAVTKKLISCLEYISANIYLAIIGLTALITFFYLVIKFFKKVVLENQNKIIRILKTVVDFLHWKNNDLTKVVSVCGVVSYSALLLFYLIMCIAFFWCLLPYSAYIKGYNLSKESVSEYVAKGCELESNGNWYGCITLYGENRTEIINGLFITRDKNKIAVFDGKFSKIIKLPNRYYIEKEYYKQPSFSPTLNW